MESTLKGPHPVLEVHGEKPVFNRGRRIVEGQQVRVRIGVTVRLLEYSILVQANDFADGLGPQVIDLLNQRSRLPPRSGG